MAVGTTNFPTSLDTVAELVEAANKASTTVSGGTLSSSNTTVTVASTTGFTSSGIIGIDDELIAYTGKTATTFTGCTRAFESTTAATHANGAAVKQYITAASHNVQSAAIIAVETKVGSGSSTPAANQVLTGSGTGTSAWGQVATGMVADAAITYAKIQNVTTNRLLGRSTAGAGAAEEISIGSGLTLSAGTLSASGGGGTPGGSSGQVQFNSGGTTFGGAAGFVYQSGASPNVAITAQNAAHVALRVNSAASPSADIFQITENDTTVRFRVTSAGEVSCPGSGTFNSQRIGPGATAAGTGAVALGASATATGAFSVALGYSATATLGGGVAVGSGANVTVLNSIALGVNATNAVSGSFVAGSTSEPVNTVVFGKGHTDAIPTAYSIIGTGGSGTNIAGAALNLAGGAGTGTGAGGSVNLRVALAGTTGSSANALTTVLTVAAATNAVTITSPSASMVGLRVEAAASPTANVIEVFSAGAVRFRVNNAGLPSCVGATGDGERFGANSAVTTNGVAIGNTAAANAVSCIAIGQNATNNVSNSFLAGSSGQPMNTVVFGKGHTNAAPTSYSIIGTGGSGTDIAGADLNFAGGVGTGTGAGGSINLRVALAGTTGSTANALTTVLTAAAVTNAVTITSPSASMVGLRVDSAASPSANILQVTNNGTNAFLVTSTGAPSGPGSASNSERYGLSSSATGNPSLAIGKSAQALFQDSTAVGPQAYANKWASVALGNFANAVAVGAVAINCYNDVANSFSCGSGAANGFGTANITTVVFGNGHTNSTPVAYSIIGTGGSGTDIAGAALNLAGGRGTGTGIPGTIGVQFARAGTTGSTANALSDEWRLDYSTTDTVRIRAAIRTSTTSFTDAAAITAAWTTATHASRTSVLDFWEVYNGGSLARAARITEGRFSLMSVADANPTTTELASLSGASIYVKGSKFVIAYNSGGSMWYITIPLDTTTTTWTHSNTAP